MITLEDCIVALGGDREAGKILFEYIPKDEKLSDDLVWETIKDCPNKVDKGIMEMVYNEVREVPYDVWSLF